MSCCMWWSVIILYTTFYKTDLFALFNGCSRQTSMHLLLLHCFLKGRGNAILRPNNAVVGSWTLTWLPEPPPSEEPFENLLNPLRLSLPTVADFHVNFSLGSVAPTFRNLNSIFTGLRNIKEGRVRIGWSNGLEDSLTKRYLGRGHLFCN